METIYEGAYVSVRSVYLHWHAPRYGYRIRLRVNAHDADVTIEEARRIRRELAEAIDAMAEGESGEG